MTEYWMSTLSPQKMFRPERLTTELEASLREHAGIDSAQIALTLGIFDNEVRSYQRYLGLRTISFASSAGGARHSISMRGHNRKIKAGGKLSRAPSDVPKIKPPDRRRKDWTAICAAHKPMVVS